jgi:hypothetical protein
VQSTPIRVRAALSQPLGVDMLGFVRFNQPIS